jgi:hypothetical protein
VPFAGLVAPGAVQRGGPASLTDGDQPIHGYLQRLEHTTRDVDYHTALRTLPAEPTPRRGCNLGRSKQFALRIPSLT